ncbi:hydrogenase maturation protease [Actinocrinis puniceicyclus]|uniref:Hydrogenase maturation protease n=1 Tax=Actinocrinis puniceicyclus TaxID=977794 RepID=A0A8J7WRE6_9ACTN|nr:hydrogenase maturation protease [Actinocrinis puniceicyclus]MBS2964622.1 hydrogenase maturation protease [Actinocrinis puniceicyclus]
MSAGSVPPGAPRRCVVIGIGNDLRHDDGFGPAVVQLLREEGTVGAEVTLAVTDGEPTGLIDLWTGADVAVVIDAVLSPTDPPGYCHELRCEEAAGLTAATASSHSVSLGSTVQLARALDRLPRVLVVLAVVGRDFGYGPGLSALVASAVPAAARRAVELVTASVDHQLRG